ncbi:hypothetical protein QBC46DRAFT_459376 [Diplogelasinospora grovesii]|uniref:Histone deacetylase domain-containing protein n=1 Tax=Diplogelasinospora grovesii TaxID=303347 RepID=A0AAN6N666_9PEZI|nr:hypothetical protein QBC46DRAFT_459376 [Diplogelasinospora grovesii]
MATPSRSPPKRVSGTTAQSHNNQQDATDKDLSQPLAPGPFKPAVNRSPSASSPRPGSAMRSPLHGPSATNGTPSRSATPTLRRKASLNSLHSANGIAPPRRASPANILSPTARSPLRSLSPPGTAEKPPLTAESVAHTYFSRELDAHHGANPQLPTETLVVLHDACYGHRYSRPRTSRAALSTVACVVGVSAAYDGAFPIRPSRDPAALPSVPFRIHKTTRRLPLSSQTVTNELKMMCDAAEARLAINGKELQRPDMDRGANAEAPRKFHEGDLYLCAESLDALEGALGGVCDAVDAVFRPQGPKRAFVAIRPPGHHCSASYPSGFCWVNNVHVGIMHAILSHGLTHAAIIDFDLHHGDGSQSIAWQHNSRSLGLAKNAAWWKKTSIGYFSLHDINSYPCEMGDEEKVKNASLCIENAHGQNVWNVHLQPWKSDADFWELYESKYSALLDKTRSYLKGQTERLRAAGLNSHAAIFLSAGFDASEWESAGMQRHNVNVPTEFYARLTRDVVRIAAEEGTSVEGRIVSVLEGGYSDRALCSGVLSHISGLAGDDPATQEQDYNGLGYEMGQKIGVVRTRKDSSASESGTRPYDPSWWSPAELASLESIVYPPPPPEQKQPRTNAPPTYSSPTTASSARVVTPRVRRSISGLSLGGSRSPSRPPSPPPPEVPWTTAASELSKLLIPSGRQTESCTHEDLNAEATRARRDRQSHVSSGSQGERAPTRMSLRERKAKPTPAIKEEDAEEERKRRRRTVAGPSDFVSEKSVSSRGTVPASGRAPIRPPGRRLSAASTVVSENVDPLKAAPPPPLPAPLNGVSRIDTSHSIRPESSMSARTAATGASLAAKKTRVPPVKKDPVPRAPRGAPKKTPGTTATGATASTKTPAARTTSGAVSRPPAVASSSASSSSNKAGDDMDKLTSGMKKIKITLVTPAQREARERERLAKEKEEAAARAAESITVATPTLESEPSLHHQPAEQTPAAPPSTNSGLPSSPVVEATITPMSTPPAAAALDHSEKQQQQQPMLPLPSFSSYTIDQQNPSIIESLSPKSLPPQADPLTPAHAGHVFTPMLLSSQPQRVPLPSSSPITPTSPTRFQQQASAPPPDVFIQYQPEGPAPSLVKQQQQQSLQWLPPNIVATPMAATPMRRTDLPVFTATSAIPFAPTGTGRQQFDESEWEIPETPQN